MVLFQTCPCCSTCCNFAILSRVRSLDIEVTGFESDFTADFEEQQKWLQPLSIVATNTFTPDEDDPLANLPARPIFVWEREDGLAIRVTVEKTGYIPPGFSNVPIPNTSVYRVTVTDTKGNVGSAIYPIGGIYDAADPNASCAAVCQSFFSQPIAVQKQDDRSFQYGLVVSFNGCSRIAEDVFGIEIGDKFLLSLTNVGGAGAIGLSGLGGSCRAPGRELGRDLCFTYVGNNRFENAGSVGVDDESPGFGRRKFYVEINPSAGAFLVRRRPFVRFYFPFNVGTTSTAGDVAVDFEFDCFSEVVDEETGDFSVSSVALEQYKTVTHFSNASGFPGECERFDFSNATLRFERLENSEESDEECSFLNDSAPRYWAFTPFGSSSSVYPPPQIARVEFTFDPAQENVFLQSPGMVFENGSTTLEVSVEDMFGDNWALDVSRQYSYAGSLINNQQPLASTWGGSMFSAQKLFRSVVVVNTTHKFYSGVTLRLWRGIDPSLLSLGQFVSSSCLPYPGACPNPAGVGLFLSVDSPVGSSARLWVNDLFPEEYEWAGKTFELSGEFRSTGFDPWRPATATVTIEEGLP